MSVMFDTSMDDSLSSVSSYASLSPCSMIPTLESAHFTGLNAMRRRGRGNAGQDAKRSFIDVFLSWYSRLINSFFAARLFALTVTILVLDVVALTIGFGLGLYHEGDEDDSLNQALGSCQRMFEVSNLIHYMGIVNGLLGAPVVFPMYAQLFRVEKKKIIRSPFLHVCEALVLVELTMMAVFVINAILSVSNTNFASCFSGEKSYAKLFLACLGFVVFVLVYQQIVVFSRFRVHLKLQAGSVSDAFHSANLSPWMKLFSFCLMPRFTRRQRVMEDIRKRLFQAVQRGEKEDTRCILLEAQERLGSCFAQEMYPTPTLYFHCIARSVKNPLHLASANNDLSILKLLLAHAFDVNALDKVDRVSFSLGHVFKLTRSLVTTQDHGEKTATFAAAFTSVLVTPLHQATVHGAYEAMQYLLEQQNADANVPPRASFFNPKAILPPLFVAPSASARHLLLQHGANPLQVVGGKNCLCFLNSHPTTVLQHVLDQSIGKNATSSSSSSSSSSSLPDAFLDLEAVGADVLLTPLHTAAAWNDVATLLHLLRNRCVYVDARGEFNVGFSMRTPLHWAAISGQASAVEILLDHEADVHAQDHLFRTPLHWACCNNHYPVVQLLLNAGANPSLRDRFDHTPMLAAAAAASRVEQIEPGIFPALIEYGADVHATTHAGDTALHLALLAENRGTATTLIMRCGADVMQTNLSGQRAMDCTASSDLRFAVKQQTSCRDVMLSYTHTHVQLASKIRHAFEEQHSITCWMDDSGIGGGSVWREEIAKGIVHAHVVVAVICEGYAQSTWCLKELAFAKLVGTPVLALIVEKSGKSRYIDEYVPQENQMDFSSFIRGCRMEAVKNVVFDIDTDSFRHDIVEVVDRLRDLFSLVAPSKEASIIRNPSTSCLEKKYIYICHGTRAQHRHASSNNRRVSSEPSETENNNGGSEGKTEAFLSLWKFIHRMVTALNASEDISYDCIVENSREAQTTTQSDEVDAFHFASTKQFSSLDSSHSTNKEKVKEEQDLDIDTKELILQSACVILIFQEDGSTNTRLEQMAQHAYRHSKDVIPILFKSSFMDLGKRYTLSRCPLFYFAEDEWDFDQSFQTLMGCFKRRLPRKLSTRSFESASSSTNTYTNGAHKSFMHRTSFALNSDIFSINSMKDNMG